MSFRYLPWPLYVILLFGMGLYIIVFAMKGIRSYPRDFSIGLVLLATGCILIAINTTIESLSINNSKIWQIDMVAIPLGVISIIFIFTGAYKGTKHDPEKHKVIRICIYTLIGTFIAMGIIALLAIYK
ncbi:hypothetical protein NDS46_28350 [Paenibacillus thiaminolyticus]|uniref:hypothetical protein n=1 Tax=Paenibacillus thiaminolyticus TaxID=49283 RepID=UPI00232F7F0D|nr:hypothetical protein [Paenibacillus thiaminolyticus]WCF08124.1 hypothetical protein NDS46_28350 [Paenibacillus thiaminolyticus]